VNIAQPTDAEILAATEIVEHYKEVLKRGKSSSPEEDQLMLDMHKQVAAGRQVINAFDAIRDGGADELRRPMLFLARAHWKRVRWIRRSLGTGHFVNYSAREPHKRNADHLDLPEKTLDHQDRAWNEYWSVVPSIPPLLRPRGRLDGYVILSEANWQAVPKDPALLRPIKWPLCAVVAVWDLTETERKVLGITRTGEERRATVARREGTST
jgi:hypothetical protein